MEQLEEETEAKRAVERQVSSLNMQVSAVTRRGNLQNCYRVRKVSVVTHTVSTVSTVTERGQ